MKDVHVQLLHIYSLKELFVILKFKATSIISGPHMWRLSSHSPTPLFKMVGQHGKFHKLLLLRILYGLIMSL